MKKSFVKLLSAFLTLTMIFGVVVTGVSAETSSDSVVYIAGALIEGSEEGYWLETDGKLTSDNASAENYNVKFEPATESTNAKLTLKNANLSQKADLDGPSFVCCSAIVLDIEILGENTITSGDYAFYLFTDSKFIGNGKLNVTGREDSQGFIISGSDVTISDNVFIESNVPYGIITEDNKVTVEGSANINIIGAGISSAGLTVKDDAVLTVDTSVIDKDISSVEMYSGDLNIGGNAVVNLSNVKESVDETEIDTKALEIHKGNVNVSDNAQFNVISSGGYESYAVYLWNGNMSVTGSAKVNIRSDNASGTAAIYTESTNRPVLTVGDNASVIAQAGTNSNSSSTAIAFYEIIASDNAVIKGIAGNNNQLEEGEEISGDRYGIYSEKITATERAEITGIAGKAGRDSVGLFGRNAIVSDECKITGVSGVAEDFSVGIAFSNAVINGNTQINAESDKASKRDSIGLSSGGTLDVSGNALINAKGGVVGSTNGISAGIRAGSAKIYGSAEIIATTAPDNVYEHRNCHGICAEILSISDNVKITASGNAKYTGVGISADKTEINGKPSIAATGTTCAMLTSDKYEIAQSGDTDIFVSTDTNPENATEWDGESILISYFDGADNIFSPYKYVKIEPAAKTHTVTYYLTAGGEVYDTKTFAEGETIIHPVPETEPGVTFVKWADEDGNPLPEVMGTEDIVAYAILSVESYDVTYMIDDLVYEKYTVTYGAEVPVPVDPKKEDYIFAGWTPEIPETMPANDLTFIAVFEPKPEDIYNLGEETYRFDNFIDADSAGHCFGMSITSAGYHIGALDIESIGGSEEADLYTLPSSGIVTDPICRYQAIQGSYSYYSTVAGGSYYLYNVYDIDSDWDEVVNYVKNHEYDNKGTLQIGYRKQNQGGHAINFLRYEEVDGQPRIYAYDNNFPTRETYFYKDEATGRVLQAPNSTFMGYIDCIALRSVHEYFSLVDGYDATRSIYADLDTIAVSGATMYHMDGEFENGERVVFEIPEGVEQVTITPLVDNATFTYLDEEYTFGNVDENTVGVLTLASESGAAGDSNFEVVNSSVAIRKPSTTTISYGDSIILHADTANIPKGGYVEWTASNDCFTYTVSEDGSTCTITPESRGSTVFTATIYDAEGNKISSAEQTMNSKAGFFQKIIAFFKKLFGLTKTIPQIYKGIF